MENNKLSKGFSAIVAIIIAAVVLAGISAVVMMKKPSVSNHSEANKESSKKPTKESVPTGEISTNIQDIVGRGQNLECDWHLPTASAENPFGTGKLYTTGNKGRSMIKGTTNGIDIDGNVIYKDDIAYSWVTVAGTTVGFKFGKAELEKMGSEMTPEQKQQAEQIRAKMIFSCKSWTPDESKFILPTGVEFK